MLHAGLEAAAPFGTAALAAMGICTKINMVPMYVAMGFSQGVMPFISYNYSSGDHKRMRGALSFSIKIVEVMLVLSAGSGDRGIRRPVPAGILSGAAIFGP